MTDSAKKYFNWEIGVAIVRVLVSIMIMHHGIIIFNAAEMAKTSLFFKSMGIPAATVMAWVVKGLEFFGGLFLLIGLFTRPILIALMVDMTVAVIVAGKGTIFSHAELPFMYLLLFALLAYIPKDKYGLKVNRLPA